MNDALVGCFDFNSVEFSELSKPLTPGIRQCQVGGARTPDSVITHEEVEEDVEVGVPQKPIPLTTRNALEGAMKHSIRLAQRSYRIAVPQFHHKKIQLLLPLYLRDSEKPDLALTLERHGDWYRAATVLYPDWAYRHARLLARPNSEWLGGFRSGSQDAS
ncbi:MAG: DUF3825 domain-containing protein [Candidatus Contendobacter sp.]|nr:DUF3825 domain-containing protein [Candidatus Contendobacter sp.]